MGWKRLTDASYTAAMKTYVPERGPATFRAERQAMATGKLNPLVDPSGFGVIRESLVRFEERPDGLYVVTVGLPVPIEVRLDTTGSMGGNVDVALKVLLKTYELSAKMLPDCDPQVAIGIFGDVQDNFPLCRPQFEMLAERIVEQLTLMVPERDGGDTPEDPHYGLFGAAYLTAAYINRIGLKRYDFTISDAPARERLDRSQLTRIFGTEAFDKAAENDHDLPSKGSLSTNEVVTDLLKEAHAFFLQVGSDSWTTRFWTDVFGAERVVVLPRTHLLAQVQATIIGLTEGTLDLQSAEEFLRTNDVTKDDARAVVRSVANIPIGAQAALPNFGKGPKAGDVFRTKGDLWPMDPSEVPPLPETDDESDGPIWGAEDQL